MRTFNRYLSAAIFSLLLCLFSLSIQAQPNGIRHVGGSDFIYIVKSDGSVSGFGNEETYGGMRVDGRGIATPQPLTFASKVKQIEAGYDMQIALLEDGTVLAWGMNDRGQFGRGPGSSRTPENPLRSATPISVPLPKDVVQIAAGGHYAMAIRSNGAVLAWGPHPGRPQGTYDVSVMTIPGLPPVSMVAAGGEHAMALTRTGEVYAWGRNNNGEVGSTPVDPFVVRKPTRVAGLDSVVSIACEGTTSFGFSGAVKADGTVWMWGSNQSATFGKPLFWGNGGPADSVVPTPTRVVGITSARTIAAGPGHIVVRLADNTLRLWGHDGWGQIGIGTSGGYHPAPKKPAIANVSAVYAAGNRTFAVKADGTVWWWGVAPSRVGGPYGRDAKVPTQITGF